MASSEEVKSVFPKMLERFSPDKAQGLTATIQFNLSGDNGGQFWVKIDNSTVEHGEGTTDNPNMTFSSSGDDFHSLVNGNLNPMQAFMMGKIKVTDVGIGMKMINVFGMS